MARTYQKVRYSPPSKERVEQAFKFLEGRWKLVILFHLFGGKMLRFSDLERAIPAISQKMLIQQLRQLERDGIVCRLVHHQVPPKVEYGLTEWGQELCPALDALLTWAEARGHAIKHESELCGVTVDLRPRFENAVARRGYHRSP